MSALGIALQDAVRLGWALTRRSVAFLNVCFPHRQMARTKAQSGRLQPSTQARLI